MRPPPDPGQPAHVFQRDDRFPRPVPPREPSFALARAAGTVRRARSLRRLCSHCMQLSCALGPGDEPAPLEQLLQPGPVLLRPHEHSDCLALRLHISCSLDFDSDQILDMAANLVRTARLNTRGPSASKRQKAARSAPPSVLQLPVALPAQTPPTPLHRPLLLLSPSRRRQPKTPESVSPPPPRLLQSLLIPVAEPEDPSQRPDSTPRRCASQLARQSAPRSGSPTCQGTL